MIGHRDDDVASLVSRVDVPMRVSDSPQRVARVDDRGELCRFREFGEVRQVPALLLAARRPVNATMAFRVPNRAVHGICTRIALEGAVVR